MALAIEDICNMALRRINYPTPIGYIYEGSRAARVAVEIYGQTRDDTMRANDYPFARRDVALVTNGQTAPAPWLFEYAYPSDCLRIRQVMPNPPGTYPILDPKPVLFTDFNDQRLTPPAKAILTNVSPATLVYTAQITDPATFDANYIEALIEGLARRFAAALADAANMVPLQDALATTATDAALGAQANRPPPLTAPRPVAAGQQRNG